MICSHSPLPSEPSDKLQEKWTKKENLAWMTLRGVKYSSSILKPEAREQVRREMARSSPPELIDISVPASILNDEIRCLVWTMYNMFRAIFGTDLAGSEARINIHLS